MRVGLADVSSKDDFLAWLSSNIALITCVALNVMEENGEMSRDSFQGSYRSPHCTFKCQLCIDKIRVIFCFRLIEMGECSFATDAL